MRRCIGNVVVGFTTLAIGSALMFVPIETKWWLFAGTFLVGFLAHLGYEYLGLNEWFIANPNVEIVVR